MTYKIIYSPESLNDLRAIYSYIAFEKLAPQNAEGQVNRIRESIRSLVLASGDLDHFSSGYFDQLLSD